MTTTMEKPTVLLIHGAWHTPAYLTPLATALRAQGHPVLLPALPTITRTSTPQPDMYTDAAFIATELQTLADTGKRVVLVMHSYGGAAGTEGAWGLGWAERRARGLEGGVVALVYLTAYLLGEGKAVVNDRPRGTKSGFGDLGDGRSIPEGRVSTEVMYSGLSVEEQTEWAAKLVPFPFGAFWNPVTKPAYRNIPCLYLRATEDPLVTIEMQDGMVKEMRDAGIDVRTADCDAGHMPMLTHISACVSIVQEAEKLGVDSAVVDAKI